MRTLAAALVATFSLGLGIPDAAGQSFQGGLRGAVKDAQGIIPGVVVTLVNEDTRVSRETITNERGGFSFPAVDPGTYILRTAVPGYKVFEQRGLRIGTQQFATMDVVLEVGSVEETVTVTGQAPLIDTANASTGNVLGKEALTDLPSLGRNVFLFSVTVPTVVRSGPGTSNRMQDQTDASRLSLGGGGVRANNYLLDGFPITEITNRPTTNPIIEATDDLKVQVHTYDAEMSRTGGGVFNVTARSGTNEFHGTAAYQTRPTELSSQLFFLDLQKVPKAPQYWRDGSGGFGGPIIKNKTFFWAAAELYREKVTRNNNFIFPTTAERNGDFSGLTDAKGNRIILYDPLTTRTDPVTGLTVRNPFSGNVIPADRINAVGANIVKYLPLPDVNADNGVANYFGQSYTIPNGEQATGKIEHHFSDAIALSGLYLYQETHSPLENYFPQAPFAAPSYQLDRTGYLVTLNNTNVVNSTTVVTLRFGYNIFNDGYNLVYPFDAHTLGFNPVFADAIQVQKFPQVTFSGYGGPGYTGRTDNRYYSNGFNGTVTKLVGSHSWKMGGDYRVIGDSAVTYGQSAGSFAFTGAFTQGPNPLVPAKTSGNPIADVLLGYPASGSVPLTTPINAYVRYTSGFVQDDFRVNSRFTLNYGIRLEHETGLTEENNHFTVGFGQNAVSPLNSLVTIPGRSLTGGLVFAGVNGAPTEQGNPLAVMVSPRAGVVLLLDKDTVLRGGYGLYWAPWNYPTPGTTSYGQYGYSAITTLQQNTLVPITSIDNPFPDGLTQPSESSLGLLTGVGGNINFVDPDKRASRIQQYSVDLQRELPGDISVGIGYVGSRGDNLSYGGTSDTGIDINQLDPKYLSLGSQLVQLVPNPFFGVPEAGGLSTQQKVQYGQLLRPFPQFLSVLKTQTTAARSRYDAIVLQLNKRTTGWWGGQFNFTWSRLEDNQFGQPNTFAANSATGRILNNYDPGAEYGPSLLDQPIKIALAPIVRLPFGKGTAHLNKGGLMNYLVGDWSVTAVVLFQSGFPIAIGQTPNNSGLFGSGQRPNIVPGVDLLVTSDIVGQLRADPSNTQYLNPAAWSAAPAFSFGNAPRTDTRVRTPKRNQLDLSFAKNFHTGGHAQAQLRVEVLNVTNTPWFNGFSTELSASNFGDVNQQGNYSRQTQIMFRFLW